MQSLFYQTALWQPHFPQATATHSQPPMPMATTSSAAPPRFTPRRNSLRSPRVTRVRCLLGRGNDSDAAPPLLRLVVSAVTELLRFTSPNGREASDGEKGDDGEREAARCVDDVIIALRADYERAYFLTGNFNYAIYSEDCLYDDPTISFRGREQYARNLKLLVPFFVHPSLTLDSLEKGVNGDLDFILAKWKLRTYLKLPWTPLISIGGTTQYELNRNLKIVRHSESWDISPLEAVGQIFTPTWRR